MRASLRPNCSTPWPPNPFHRQGQLPLHDLLSKICDKTRIIQTCYEIPIDHRGVRRVLELHQLSPEVLRLHYQTTQQAALPPFPAGQQLDLALEPPTPAQRLLQT